MQNAHENLAPFHPPLAGNGILACVPGAYVGQAQHSLPDPATFPGDEVHVEVHAGWLGPVRLTFRKYRYRRPKGKFSAVAWSCHHAERVPRSEQADEH